VITAAIKGVDVLVRYGHGEIGLTGWGVTWLVVVLVSLQVGRP
jgi:hypothetical protein